MTVPLAFSDLLDLVDERSAALRKAVAEAPDLTARVPSCPDWALSDLLGHITGVHLFWAAAVAAGPGFTPQRPELETGLPAARALADAEAATAAMLAALREAGPDRACWTWWQGSDVPGDSGAIARHQVQEAAVHAHDAQLALGAPLPLPEAVALDGLAEFRDLYWAMSAPWPHAPAAVRLRTAEGPELALDLAPAEAAPGQDPAVLELAGTASDLLLALHRRRPSADLLATGDPAVLEQLLAWPRLG
ncbi:maleylpyruvate isomerase N-terminal domain-containing protein [Kitasatospora sp. NPDC088783]|uniref:maleylpyruvate isomerase N-terminal domain-containing protein n=2 Tax=unclassified Kitasatospora TaxID=2633591 RepID=UPI003810669D